MTTNDTPPFLTAADIAALWSKERQDAENVQARAEGRAPRTLRPVSPKTVWAYHQWSMPPRSPEKQGIRNRYEDNPMPLATHIDPRRPMWFPAQGQTLDGLRRELVAWWNSRSGPGVGGGAGTHRRNQYSNEWEVSAAAKTLSRPQRLAILSDVSGNAVDGAAHTVRSLVNRGLAVWTRLDPPGGARLTTKGAQVREHLLSTVGNGAA